jgi:hypothetical protein
MEHEYKDTRLDLADPPPFFSLLPSIVAFSGLPGAHDGCFGTGRALGHRAPCQIQRKLLFGQPRPTYVCNITVGSRSL